MVVMPKIQQTVAKSENKADIHCSLQGLQRVGIHTKKWTLDGPETKKSDTLMQCISWYINLN
jgi:hypothetical protein